MSDIPLGALAKVPRLILSLFFTYLRFKRKMKKGTKRLRKSLIKGGMDKKMANELASRYEESLSIRKLLKSGILKGASIPFFS